MNDGALRLYRTLDGLVVRQADDGFYSTDIGWDDLFTLPDAAGLLSSNGRPTGELSTEISTDRLSPPIEGQEVWAAGVTYKRSRAARRAEAAETGGSDFYDRVYDAARPELFFKAPAHRVSGHGQALRVRRDSRWSVPEPELALAVNREGAVIGYTIGNDMSARDIEGENPLYLPQAKTWDRCCGLGPALLLTDRPLPPETEIRMEIERQGASIFEGSTTLSAMKRTSAELVGYLYRESSFPRGCFLLTGTGVVPPDDFSLQGGDTVRITIEPIGTLVNRIERR